MPKKPKYELVTARYFQWRLAPRNGVWTADGRTNKPSTGRHSLGTRDRAEALQILNTLDATIAVKRGLAKREMLDRLNASSLTIVQGFELYKKHLQRPRIAGGVRPSTYSNYLSVIKKFQEFCLNRSIEHWREIGREEVEAYASRLEHLEYRSKSIRNEIVTLIQAQKWLLEVGVLTGISKIQIKLRKIESQRHYCFQLNEYQAMAQYCQLHPELAWLSNIIVGLAYTGMRISELLTLRWANVDLIREKITLVDQSGHDVSEAKRVHLKSGQGRILPIAAELLSILNQLSIQDPVFRGPDNVALDRRKVLKALKSKVIEPLLKTNPKFKLDEFGSGCLHSFRHFFISMCANRGVPIQTLMSWVGHNSTAMIRHYYTLHDHEAGRQIRKLDFETKSGTQPADSQAEKQELPIPESQSSSESLS